MTPLLTILQAATGIAFLGYGLACLLSPQLRLDFERFGLARFRVLTGTLEVAGGLGLLAGLRWPVVGLLAAGGLTALMALGVWARARVGDSLLAMSPALLFFAINAWLVAVQPA